MACLQDSCYMFKSLHAPKLKFNHKKQIMSALNIPNTKAKQISVPNRVLMEELQFGLPSIILEKKPNSIFNVADNSMVVKKIQAILEAIADRIEMHKNIGEQRNNWNTLLLTSINGITLAAATMSGIAATTTSHLLPGITALKLSSTILYLSATCLLIIMNKIQPSQLVEEQRNATRLFQQLHNQIQTSLKLGTHKVTNKDVKEAMEKVLALDKAYPLPLLGVMLEKFPSFMESAVWWPKQQHPKQRQENDLVEWNGWNGKLEKEMRQIVEVIRKKDEADYLRLGAKALKMNKILSVTGPVLTGMAAIGSAFGLVGSSSSSSSWGTILGIVGGALASIVNTIEHGGQVGMVFEMYRNNAGFFKFMEESIESNLMETEVERRENGELLELKVALQLGRSLSELRDLASSSSNQTSQTEEFACKIF